MSPEADSGVLLESLQYFAEIRVPACVMTLMFLTEVILPMIATLLMIAILFIANLLEILLVTPLLILANHSHNNHLRNGIGSVLSRGRLFAVDDQCLAVYGWGCEQSCGFRYGRDSCGVNFGRIGLEEERHFERQ